MSRQNLSGKPAFDSQSVYSLNFETMSYEEFNVFFSAKIDRIFASFCFKRPLRPTNPIPKQFDRIDITSSTEF